MFVPIVVLVGVFWVTYFVTGGHAWISLTAGIISCLIWVSGGKGE